MQKDKITLIIAVIAVCLFVLMLMAAAFILFRIYLKRKNTLLLEKERMGVQFEQTLLRSQLEIQEQTFSDISREIHDNIGQVLSLVRINLNTIELPGEGGAQITRMDDLLGKAITDLRNLSHVLDADQIRNNGWVQAIQKLMNDIRSTGKFEVTTEIAANIPPLGPEKPIILFRMMQEVVNNIIKHSGAKKIVLQIVAVDNNVRISIIDDGSGFDTTSVSAGAGLRNLEKRAAMINSKLHIISEKDKGTNVTISINSITHT